MGNINLISPDFEVDISGVYILKKTIENRLFKSENNDLKDTETNNNIFVNQDFNSLLESEIKKIEEEDNKEKTKFIMPVAYSDELKKRILSVPATSTENERTFSISGNVCTRGR